MPASAPPQPENGDTPTPLPPPPWRRGSGKPPRNALSTGGIVTAALRIMAEEGLDAVSMRRVAQALDTGPASLYAHVRNKQELHELMLEVIYDGVDVPTPRQERWREQLKRTMLDVTRVLLRNPGAAEISMRTLIPTTPGMLVLMDAVLGILRTAGFSDRVASRAADALALQSTAFAFEAAQWPGSGDEEARRRIAEIEEYLRSLPADRLPHLAAMREDLAGGADSDDAIERFEFALDVFLDGLAARLESER